MTGVESSTLYIRTSEDHRNGERSMIWGTAIMGMGPTQLVSSDQPCFGQ